MLKIGVIGAGHLGKVHLRLLKDLSETYTLVGFYDKDGSVAAQVATELGVQAFETADSLANEVDAMVIASPTTTHADYARQMMRRGKHVFIEKPVTSTPDEAAKLMKLVEEARVVAQVGHVERFNPAFLAVADRNLQPMFIEGHRLAPWNPRGADVSVVHDLMIHDLDIVLKLVNSGIKRVSANGVAVISDTPDICNARIEFHNGCVANLTASRISTKQMRRLRLFQRDAYVTLDFLDKKAEIFNVTDAAPAEGGFVEMEMDGRKRYLLPEMPEVAAVNAIEEELKAFAKAILRNDPPAVSLLEGYMAIEAAHQIAERISAYESSLR
jgi:predicted dehydrogenase